MNIPSWLILVLIAIVAFFVLALLWGRIGKTVGGVLKLAAIVVLVGGGLFFVVKLATDPFERAVWQNRGNSAQAYLTAFLEDNFGVTLPASGLVFNPPQAAAPSAEAKPTITAAGLGKPLPQIPDQVKEMKIADLLSFKGPQQKTVEIKDILVEVAGVISPTLSSQVVTTSTIGTTNVISEDLPVTLTISNTVWVEIFPDQTIVVTGKNPAELMRDWLQKTKNLALEVAKLDQRPDEVTKVDPDAKVRGELSEVMNRINVMLDFDPVMIPAFGSTSNDRKDIPQFTETQNLVDRVGIVIFSTDNNCGVREAPLPGADGRPALYGMTRCLIRQYHRLDARANQVITLLDSVTPKEQQADWVDIHEKVLRANQEISALIEMMEAEIVFQGKAPADVYDSALMSIIANTEVNLQDVLAAVEAP